MEVTKRINQIVNLTVDDFLNTGHTTNEPIESLLTWLNDELLQIELIEDYNTYQVSILILDKLQSLDIVDLEFIHEIMFKDGGL